MGMLDKAKDLAKGNADKVKEGLDKAGDMVDEKTGGKFGDKIDQAKDMVGDKIDGEEEAAE